MCQKHLSSVHSDVNKFLERRHGLKSWRVTNRNGLKRKLTIGWEKSTHHLSRQCLYCGWLLIDGWRMTGAGEANCNSLQLQLQQTSQSGRCCYALLRQLTRLQADGYRTPTPTCNRWLLDRTVTDCHCLGILRPNNILLDQIYHGNHLTNIQIL